MPRPWRSALFVLAALLVPAAARAQFDAPLIDTRSTSTATNVGQDARDRVPAARDPWSLATTAPGVAPDRSTTVASNGGLMTIDGIVVGNQDALGSGSLAFDMIKDLEVRTGGYSAEYGNSAGGVIRVVTKGGTTQWGGTGRYLVEEGDPSGIGSLTSPGIRIDIAEAPTGGFCLDGYQVLAGGAPVVGGAGTGPVQFGFDVPFTIGVGPSSQTTFGAGRSGGLNLSQIPGCTGKPFGLSFVDAPRPVTPPNPTHLFVGANGAYAVDMGRIGLSYGIRYEARPDYKLEDTHIFSSSFYLSGISSYVNGGFQAVRDAGSRGVGKSVFLYGTDPKDFGGDWAPRVGLPWDRNAFRMGDSPVDLPDIDGDGKSDSVFLQLATLTPIGQNAIGGGFTAGTKGTGGGTLVADPDFAGEGYAGVADAVRGGRGFSGSRFSFLSDPRLNPGGVPLPSDIGGPILRDKLWFFGTYEPPATDDGDDDAPLFSESFYQRAPNYNQLFPHGFFTEGSVQRAPGGRGVQDIGLEVDGQHEEIEPAWIEGDRYAPGGAALVGADDMRGDTWLQDLADELDVPLIYVVAQGGPTGEVFRVQVVQPQSGPVGMHGLLAVEPLAATAEDRARFERELAELPGEKYAMTAAGYCLQMDALAPPAGTVYRVAPAEKQAAFAPMRRALDAARRLRDAGALHPDSDPTDYYHSIRQWAVWTVEKGFDRAGFLDAFVERMEKNFRDAGQPWSAEVAAAVRSYGEGRWTDIEAILGAAEATP